jgi:nucleotide-binding universal stress UspA family protein
MGEDPGKGQIIVVGVDGSPGSHTALGWALTEAVARHGSVQAVFALPNVAPGYPAQTQNTVQFMGQKALGRALDGWEASGVKVELVAERGSASEVIQHAADKPEVALVVVGTRGRSRLAEMVLGSVSHTVSHLCSKPIVVVPGDALTVSRRHAMVVGVDGSREADLALRWAAEEAVARDAELEVVMVTPASRHASSRPGSPSASHDDVANGTLRASIDNLGPTPAQIRPRALTGDPAQVLVDEASTCELLVVGSRGRGQTKEALLGSVSHRCAHQTEVAVVIVPLRQGSDHLTL